MLSFSVFFEDMILNDGMTFHFQAKPRTIYLISSLLLAVAFL